MSGFASDLGLGGLVPTKAIINPCSTGGGAGTPGLAAGRELLSGPLTANTFATVLSATGQGEVPLLTCYTKDSTSRWLRMRVTVDGVVVFNPAASAAITASGAGIYAAGSVSSNGYFVQGLSIRYTTSFQVEVAGSLTETDKVAIGYILHQA